MTEGVSEDNWSPEPMAARGLVNGRGPTARRDVGRDEERSDEGSRDQLSFETRSSAINRSEPILLSYPITTSVAPNLERNKARYSQAVNEANCFVKGKTSTRSMPAASSNAFFSSSDESSLKSLASCCSTVRG